MKTAAQIMKKKTAMRAELEKHLPKEDADALWQQATDRLSVILTRYADLPKAMRFHTESRIFPSAAIYLTAKERLGEETAFGIVENAAIELTDQLGKKLARLMRLPGMRSLFVRVWDPLVRKVFGPDNGFRNAFYPKQKGEYRMDVLACPYCRYFTELGCPELTRIYCENDERTYGHLPGIAFERTGTLGKGADRCDFLIRKV
ncbi:MAG: L-2-amino-thiazoline-4-carboxylic acid hydrolase [Clostridia bacterium]|nr:L-2-amino-thiazoline-4-carboxylic acid hydrolase [Clostridia bacterium]